jgi:hypothetical protein
MSSPLSNILVALDIRIEPVTSRVIIHTKMKQSGSSINLIYMQKYCFFFTFYIVQCSLEYKHDVSISCLHPQMKRWRRHLLNLGPFTWGRKQIQFPKRRVWTPKNTEWWKKPSNSICYTPSTEPFKIYWFVWFTSDGRKKHSLTLSTAEERFIPCYIQPGWISWEVSLRQRDHWILHEVVQIDTCKCFCILGELVLNLVLEF